MHSGSCSAVQLGHSEYVFFKVHHNRNRHRAFEQNGGYVSITAVVIIMSGIVGNVASPFVLKILKITDPVAKGVAIGTSSHAIGTAKALEMGKVEGAVSSLCIVVAGIMTVIEVLLVRTII